MNCHPCHPGYRRSVIGVCIVALTGCGDSPAAGPAPQPARAALHVTAGSDQTGTVATALAQPLVVTAMDAAGRGVPDIAITWSAEDGAGQVKGAAVTGQDGRASANWQLGTRAGSVSAVARAGQLEARFTARAAPGPPHSLAELTGDGQVATRVGTLPVPLSVRVFDRFGNAAANARHRWSILAGSGSMKMSPWADSSGYATAEWTLGAVADTQRVEFITGDADDLSHVFTAVLQPTGLTMAASAASLGVGGSVRLSAAATDAAGTTLTGPFVYASAAPHILSVDAAGTARGVAAGSTTVTAALAGLAAAADFEVIEYTAFISGSMIAADSGSIADHVASATVEGATYASPVHAAGGFTLVGPFFVPPFEIFVDAMPATPRRYLPSLITIDYLRTSGGPDTTLLIPAAWLVRGGTWDGATVGISMIKAIQPPCNDASNSNCRGFFPSYWSGDPKVWPASALPVPVAFDHVRSTSPITESDSVAFWQHVAQMNADLGRTWFRPARTAELTVLSDGTADGAILVRTEDTLPSLGRANWWWDGAGDLYKGLVLLRGSAILHSSRIVTHEMLHTLGHSHTCSWHSVMGGYGCSSEQRLSLDDVAYAQLAARLKTMRRLTAARSGIAEAYAGESLLRHRSGFILAATLSSILHTAADIEARGFDSAH